MKVTISGFNYEGALFRGIPSDTDQRMLTITLESNNERDLCGWILDEFSYGDDDEIATLKELAEGYNNGDVINMDGCGGVFEMIVKGEKLFDDNVEGEWDWREQITEEDPLMELGTVNIDKDTRSLNSIVRENI